MGPQPAARLPEETPWSPGTGNRRKRLRQEHLQPVTQEEHSLLGGHFLPQQRPELQVSSNSHPASQQSHPPGALRVTPPGKPQSHPLGTLSHPLGTVRVTPLGSSESHTPGSPQSHALRSRAQGQDLDSSCQC